MQQCKSSWPRGIALLVLGTFFPGLSEAGFSMPVSWEESHQIDFRSALSAQYASHANLLLPSVSRERLGHALQDRDNRIGKDFKVPAEIRKNVEFWLKVYVEYTTHHVVFFDGRHPEVIYEVLDFREVAATAKSRLIYEVIVKNRLKAKINQYKKAFSQLARNPRPRNPSPAERAILAAVRNGPHKHSLKEYGETFRMQTGQRDNVIKGLVAAETLLPKMELVFAGFGLPPELTRLSLVESSFNPKAVSRSGAVGVWQFMPESGKEYLTIDERTGIDERISPLKSTVAAAKLLKRNYRMLHSWPLAVTAYNHGTRNLRRLASKNSDFADVAHVFRGCGKKARGVGWASRNYYSEFLALLHAETYRELFYGDTPIPATSGVMFRALPRASSALAFAMGNGISLHEFQKLNPDIRNFKQTLPAGFVVAIPSQGDDLRHLLQSRVRAKNRS